MKKTKGKVIKINESIQLGIVEVPNLKEMAYFTVLTNFNKKQFDNIKVNDNVEIYYRDTLRGYFVTNLRVIEG